MKAKEVMTKEVVTLSLEDTALQAMQKLLERNISGLPVVDANKKVVGVFTENDIIRRLLPSYIEKVGSFVYEENPKIVKKRIQALSKIKVKDVMRKDFTCIKEDRTLCEVAKIMLTEKRRRVVVLDKQLKIMGIVSRGDIIKALNKEALSE